MTPEGKITLDLGRANRKQARFYTAQTRYVAYGGARGGGKSHAVRVQALRGALGYPGCRILIVRRTYPDLQNSLVDPMRRMLPPELARYNGTLHRLELAGGSVIKFGHFSGREDEQEYQGQEYDWIFIDEATQLTERSFRVLGACLRGVNRIPKRMYLTCNPGGVGHQWVKRLFITRDYGPGERGEDYTFIPATVEDNDALMRASPEYLRMLDLLPEDLRRAHRYGDWDALAGQYFSEFRESVHMAPDFPIPREWMRYRVFDYGLDRFYALWIAVDFDGNWWVYREVQQEGLIVSQAAELLRRLTPPDEPIAATLAPPDLWSRQKDTGRTMAEIFQSCGVTLLPAPSGRVRGWLLLKEALRREPDRGPRLRLFHSCRGLSACLQALQHSPDNPNDCDTEPHEITHGPDALRYFAAYRSLGPERGGLIDDGVEITPSGGQGHGYQAAMTGGEAPRSYLDY